VDPSESKPIINFLEKNNLQLNYILNTHHHYDHVGGNTELKKKYKAKIVGFEGDCERIPEIDIMLKDGEIWKQDNFEAKVIHIPGHTLGHICFYFYNENNLFTGDTLFSLGCGRIFEGTYEQMFASLEKIKKLPLKTKIYCGHEYTLQNSKFCITYDGENQNLIKKIQEIKEKLTKNKPTIPSTLEEELKNNIFLRSGNDKIKTNLNMNNSSSLITFSKLRDLKDNF
jgi:hydroxyacylglutathione hydrolase